jgi:hypothetical protein
MLGGAGLLDTHDLSIRGNDSYCVDMPGAIPPGFLTVGQAGRLYLCSSSFESETRTTPNPDTSP